MKLPHSLWFNGMITVKKFHGYASHSEASNRFLGLLKLIDWLTDCVNVPGIWPKPLFRLCVFTSWVQIFNIYLSFFHNLTSHLPVHLRYSPLQMDLTMPHWAAQFGAHQAMKAQNLIHLGSQGFVKQEARATFASITFFRYGWEHGDVNLT